MEKYITKKTLNAVLFEKGMEEGFVTRYYNSQENNPDGSLSTWGIQTEDLDSEIEVPYITDGTGRKILSKGYGKEYICEKDGWVWLLDKDKFESNYKLFKDEKKIDTK